MVPNYPAITTILKSQIASGNVSVVWGYTGTPRAWQFYMPGKFSTLTTMNDGVGYWVYMKANETLYVNGTVIPTTAPPPSYSLVAGWNLVGFKPQRPFDLR